MISLIEAEKDLFGLWKYIEKEELWLFKTGNEEMQQSHIVKTSKNKKDNRLHLYRLFHHKDGLGIKHQEEYLIKLSEDKDEMIWIGTSNNNLTFHRVLPH